MKILDLQKIDQAEAIEAAVAVLRHGGSLIYPTETVYGLGVDATNARAVGRLLAYKARRQGKPLSVAVSDEAMAARYVELNEQARALYGQFLPGPMTIISEVRGARATTEDADQKMSASLAPGVASEFATLGIRIPDYPLVRELARRLGRPITATSANASGKRRPYTVAQILTHLTEKQRQLIDLILDAGELPTRPPSTVVDTTLSTPLVMRSGALVNSPLLGPRSIKAPLTLLSRSADETKALAGKLVLKHWSSLSKRPLVIALDGALGVGKTVFAQGVARFLRLPEHLTSPTYTYVEEYSFHREGESGRLIHADVWKVDSPELFDRLQFASYLTPRTVFIIEWFSQVKEWLMPVLQKSRAKTLVVNIGEDDDPILASTRHLEVHEL